MEFTIKILIKYQTYWKVSIMKIQCDGDEMQFNKGLISIKIEDNKDYKPMVITHRNN